jgi:hypothetical protein
MFSDRLRAVPGGVAGEIARYRWRAVDPGTYTLVVAALRYGTPVVSIPDVAVPPPEGGDPRLVQIDLREALQMLQLTLHFPDRGDEERAPSAQRRAVVFLLPQPDDRDWTGISTWGETVALPLPKGPVDLMIASDGNRPVTLRGVEGAAEVTIEPWPLLELHLPGAAELPEGVKLRAGLNASAPERNQQRFVTDHQNSSLDRLLAPPRGSVEVENGKATLSLLDGVQELRILVQVGRHTKPLEQVTPREVVAGLPVTVQLSADEIRRVAAELQQKHNEKR